MKSDIGIQTVLLKSKITMLQSKIQELEKILEDMNLKMELINGNTDVWKGKVQRATYERYIREKNKFPGIIAELQSYKTFLEKTVENYENEEKMIDNSVNIEDLSINE